NGNYIEFFSERSNRIFKSNEKLKKLQNPIDFHFTTHKGIEFTEIFTNILNENQVFAGNDFDGNVKRIGLIAYRICMILTVLRSMDMGSIPNPLVCSETDFHTSIALTTTLIKHSFQLFCNLGQNKLDGNKLKFYEALPNDFNREQYLKVANRLELNIKTAEKYLKEFREHRFLSHDHNKYKKIEKNT
ncbi:MAG: DUF3987 domain-containing protein, partial [Prolixibacteraceae bacterium]|nr:DUF3987 domain-containing protein [Prolixibacteraceae bacterium]